MDTRQLTFRVFGASFSGLAAEPLRERARADVARANARARLPDLDDALNPLVLDDAKVNAFFDMLDAATAPVPTSSPLVLNDELLLLGAWAPLDAKDVATADGLEPAEGARVRLRARIDADRAREHARRADEQRAACDARVRELEAIGATDAEAHKADSLARRQRYAAAIVAMRCLVLAAGATTPPDHAIEEAIARARQEVGRCSVAPWTGMP